MAINPKIKQKAEDIRKKIFGSEVRESLASGLEGMSEDVESIKGRQGNVEQQFQDVLDETTDKDFNSAPEIKAARNGKSNLKTRLDDEHAQVTAQLQQTDNKVNSLFSANLHDYMDHVKTTDGVTDHTDVLKEAINSVSRGIVYIPFNINIFDTIDIKDNITLVGDYRANTTIHIMKDVIGLRMIGTNTEIDSFTVKINVDNYSKSAVQLSSKLDGHSWLPKIKNIYFYNSLSNPSGVALSIKPLNGFGIMQFLIQENQFRGFDIAVHTPSKDDGFNGWLSGNTMRENWFDFCRVGLQSDSSLSQMTIENFSGQYNAGVSEAHMNLNECTKLKIVDSMMWDGGRINVGQNARYTTIIGGFPTHDKIKDEGYKTHIEEVFVGQDDMITYIYDRENFEGFKLANKWDTHATGTGYIKTGAKRVSPTIAIGKTVLELGTGVEQNSFSEVDYGGVYPYPGYTSVVMNFGLSVPDTTNLIAQVGLKHDGYVPSDKIAGHMFEIADGVLYPTKQKHSGQREQLEGIPLNSDRCFVQIHVSSSGSEQKVLYHVDGRYVGALTNSMSESVLQPFFNIKNTEPKDKQLRVFDLVIRRTNFFWTTTVWD